MLRREQSGERFNETQGLPLFGGEEKKIREPKSTLDKIAWARTLILRSELLEFTAENVRNLIAGYGAMMIGSGNWLGSVLQSSWFEKIRAENATRPEAHARTIWRYRLTPEGAAQRRKLKQENVR